jgi:hypothetical protein
LPSKLFTNTFIPSLENLLTSNKWIIGKSHSKGVVVDKLVLVIAH